jgi:hypothetical protein
VIPFAPLLALLVRLRRGSEAGGRLTLVGGAMVVLLAVSRLFRWASRRCDGVGSSLSKFVRREWLNRAKASTDGLSVAVVVALLWRHTPRWGHHWDALFLAAQGLSKVKTLSFMDVRRRRLWCLALLGGVAFGIPTWIGGGGGWLVLLLARGGR